MCSKNVKVNLLLFVLSKIYAEVQGSGNIDPRISAVA
jgi:hypothetical protein